MDAVRRSVDRLRRHQERLRLARDVYQNGLPHVLVAHRREATNPTTITAYTTVTYAGTIIYTERRRDGSAEYASTYDGTLTIDQPFNVTVQ